MKSNGLVAVAVLVAAISSPALAQPAASWAPAHDHAPRHLHSSNPAFDVYENGQYIGSDPDPNIRAQLRFGHGSAGEW